MKILSLNLFKLFKKRVSKLRAAVEAMEKARSENEKSAEVNAYTLVKSPKQRATDMLTTIHMTSKHLDAARTGHKSGKARWLHSKNQQHYKPRELRIDRQLEYIYEELGLAKELESNAVGPIPKAM